MSSVTLPQLDILLDQAASFHTHLGPFLVLGLKAGLSALRELESRQGDPRLHAKIELPYRVPISCLLDGVQFSTGCTVGNKRLVFTDSTDIILTFTRGNTAVGISLKQDCREILGPLFDGQNLGEEKLHELAHNLVASNEDNLFLMNRKQVAK